MKKIASLVSLLILSLALVGCDLTTPVAEEKVNGKTLEELKEESGQAFKSGVDAILFEIGETETLNYNVYLEGSAAATLTDNEGKKTDIVADETLEINFKQKDFTIEASELEDTIYSTGSLFLEVTTRTALNVKIQEVDTKTVIKTMNGLYIQDNWLYIYQEPHTDIQIEGVQYKIDLSKTSASLLKEIIYETFRSILPSGEPSETNEVPIYEIDLYTPFMELATNVLGLPTVVIKDQKAVYTYDYKTNDSELEMVEIQVGEEMIPIGEYAKAEKYLLDFMHEDLLGFVERLFPEEIDYTQYQLATASLASAVTISSLGAEMTINNIGSIEKFNLRTNILLDISSEFLTSMEAPIASIENSSLDLLVNFSNNDTTEMKIVMPNYEYQEITLEEIINGGNSETPIE